MRVPVLPAVARALPSSRELVVAGGMAASQLSVYALNIAASRSLGTTRYGELAALLTLTVLMSVPALALQSWVARAVATTIRQGGDLGQVHRATVATVARLAAGSVLLTVVVTPSLSPFLALPPTSSTLAAALVVLPMAALAAAQGALQGAQLLRRLALVYAVGGLGRALGGGVALVMDARPWEVVVGVGVGTVLATLVAWRVARLPHRPGPGSGAGAVLRIAAGTGAVFALANIDVVLARSLLAPEEAGLYAAGALVTRAVLWAPQFVGVSAFAGFTDPNRAWSRLVRGAEKVTLLGGAAVVVLLAVGPWLVRTVLGEEYAAVGGLLWGFALLGLLLALTQLVVSQRIARSDERAAQAVWLAALTTVLLTVFWLRGSREDLLAALLMVAGVTTVLLVARARRRT